MPKLFLELARLRTSFLLVGLIIVSTPLLIGTALGSYQHLDNAQNLPPVHKFVSWSDDWLPKAAENADPNRFLIEGDKDESQEGDLAVVGIVKLLPQ